MIEADEGIFAYHSRRIAASARQWFRAVTANDLEAAAISLFYLSDYLLKVLSRHLSLSEHPSAEALWNVDSWRLVSLTSLAVDIELPRRIQIRAAVVCELSVNPIASILGLPSEKTDKTRILDLSNYPFGTRWQEPFEFELQLQPAAGRFQEYQFRLGSYQPFGDKLLKLEDAFSGYTVPVIDFPPEKSEWLVEVKVGKFPGAALPEDSLKTAWLAKSVDQAVCITDWGDLYRKACREWQCQLDIFSSNSPNKASDSVVCEDKFIVSDNWLAAEARQLKRACSDGDSEAIKEVARGYFENYLTNTLRRHLQQTDPAWDGSSRWFDGVDAELEFPTSEQLRLRGDVAWVLGQKHWYYDPLDFELNLCPTTGAFQGYRLRFGDHRTLAAKTSGSVKAGMPLGEWAFEFERPRQATETEPRT